MLNQNTTMPKVKVVVDQENFFDSEESLGSDPDTDNEERPEAEQQDEDRPDAEQQDEGKSGMASVIARILSKDTSKSSRVLLAKGKTSKEILRDISERKRRRENPDTENSKSKPEKESRNKSEFSKEETKKMWESMGRRIPSILDNPREVKLRKIATQGMVQLFRLVSARQMQG